MSATHNTTLGHHEHAPQGELHLRCPHYHHPIAIVGEKEAAGEGRDLRDQNPPGSNTAGNNWHVGRRWDQLAKFYGGNVLAHQACRNHLLYHGLWQMCGELNAFRTAPS
jgi:hypothetical protein